ncbi:SAM-dependent chlorinase/fluorinase, partial [Staphylococcus aureus]|nr:SAM-dependent chlorinase/fluorinase [Staphylococcus aureus]
GRDVYAYNGARLAANKIAFERLGQAINVDSIEALEIREVTKNEDSVTGSIDILDIRFGSLWTNIPLAFLKSLEIVHGN